MSGDSRRTFLQRMLWGLGGLALPLNGFLAFWSQAWGESIKKVLPRGMTRESLVNENPAQIDARALEVTPLEKFETMGLTDHQIPIDQWTLKVKGLVGKPLVLSYAQIRALPSIERKVLLICPGFFANQGLWKGISIRTLLEKARAKSGVNYVTIRGPGGPYTKTERFPVNDALSDKVFLAYQVNGIDLPQKHGFPLRVVAEDVYGDSWVKYVDTLLVERV